MPSWLNKRFRVQAGAFVAALYAFCVLAPHAVLALTNSTAHCLTGPHGAAHVHHKSGAVEKHVHADGRVHSHSQSDATEDSPNADGQRHADPCCGLFCVSAISLEPHAILCVPVIENASLTHFEDFLSVRGTERISLTPIA